MTCHDFYDDFYDEEEPLSYCQYQFKDSVQCLQVTIGGECEQCGKPLCMQHMETGVNFCDSCPTDDYRPSYLPEIDKVEFNETTKE